MKAEDYLTMPFESYVISYRTKTKGKRYLLFQLFESYVISYRTKTFMIQLKWYRRFESYVISYRTKTNTAYDIITEVV